MHATQATALKSAAIHLPIIETTPNPPRRRPRLPGALPPEQRGALPANEASAFIGCGKATLYRLVNRGELHPLKIGRATVFRVPELQALLDRAATRGAVVMQDRVA